MSKNKVIIIVVLVIIFIVGCVLLVYDSYRNSANNSVNSALPSSYAIAVTENGISFTGKLVNPAQSAQLTAAQLNKYLIININNTGDFMNILCPSGYQNTAASATNGINVGHDLDFGTTADIVPNQQGTITVSCVKT
jgi:hypothetical protein